VHHKEQLPKDYRRNMPAKQIPNKYSPGYLDNLDGRLAVATVMRERYRAFTDDLGGSDSLSYAKRSLVERALWLEYWLAEQEQALAKGQDFDVGKWTQAANALQGILTKLGLDRQAKDVPHLHDYLKQRANA